MNPPSGCPFQTRCRYKHLVPDNLCETQLPPLKELGGGHQSLCWLSDDVLAQMDPVISFAEKSEVDPAAAPPADDAPRKVTKAPRSASQPAASALSAPPKDQVQAKAVRGQRKIETAPSPAAARAAISVKERPTKKTGSVPATPATHAAVTVPAEKGRPAGVRRPARPDDLKLISGVGPKIEGLLNELGIYTFAQIAGWKKAERAWVEGHLNFGDRIERDDWVRQAKALAKGGEAEYIKVFGKKPR
jgi:peptide/nickel transport system ATP-binding protein